MSEPKCDWGISLAGLGAYALWVHSLAFFKHGQGAPASNVWSSRFFERYAQGVWLVLEEQVLLYMRFAQGCRPPRCFGRCGMAYMGLRKHSSAMIPLLVGNQAMLGLGHNTLFAGARGRTVAETAAMKRGFLR